METKFDLNFLYSKLSFNKFLNEYGFVRIFIERYDVDFGLISHHIGPDVNVKPQFLYNSFYEEFKIKDSFLKKIVTSNAFLWDYSFNSISGRRCDQKKFDFFSFSRYDILKDQEGIKFLKYKECLHKIFFQENLRFRKFSPIDVDYLVSNFNIWGKLHLNLNYVLDNLNLGFYSYTLTGFDERKKIWSKGTAFVEMNYLDEMELHVLPSIFYKNILSRASSEFLIAEIVEKDFIFYEKIYLNACGKLFFYNISYLDKIFKSWFSFFSKTFKYRLFLSSYKLINFILLYNKNFVNEEIVNVIPISFCNKLFYSQKLYFHKFKYRVFLKKSLSSKTKFNRRNFFQKKIFDKKYIFGIYSFLCLGTDKGSFIKDPFFALRREKRFWKTFFHIFYENFYQKFRFKFLQNLRILYILRSLFNEHFLSKKGNSLFAKMVYIYAKYIFLCMFCIYIYLFCVSFKWVYNLSLMSKIVKNFCEREYEIVNSFYEIHSIDFLVAAVKEIKCWENGSGEEQKIYFLINTLSVLYVEILENYISNLKYSLGSKLWVRILQFEDMKYDLVKDFKEKTICSVDFHLDIVELKQLLGKGIGVKKFKKFLCTYSLMEHMVSIFKSSFFSITGYFKALNLKNCLLLNKSFDKNFQLFEFFRRYRKLLTISKILGETINLYDDILKDNLFFPKKIQPKDLILDYIRNHIMIYKNLTLTNMLNFYYAYADRKNYFLLSQLLLCNIIVVLGRLDVDNKIYIYGSEKYFYEEFQRQYRLYMNTIYHDRKFKGPQYQSSLIRLNQIEKDRKRIIILDKDRKDKEDEFKTPTSKVLVEKKKLLKLNIRLNSIKNFSRSVKKSKIAKKPVQDSF